MGVGLVILIVVVVLAVGVYVLYYNGFVNKRNMAEQAFSTIDVMLKKRCDLVPNLVATVRQYMEHEASTLTKISEYRSRAMDPKAGTDARVSANNEMGRLLGGLMVQVENYPELKANVNFLNLQGSLNEIEEQLSAARRAFNAAVTDYNTSVEMFPGSIIASNHGFKRRALLEIAPADRERPDVHSLFKR